MARKLKIDRLLFLTTLVLVAVSIVMVYSASNQLGAWESIRTNGFLMKQAVFAVMGLMAMFVAMRIDYERYRDPRLVLGLVGFTLLALVAVLIVGPEINGTHRWFAVAGVGIQPSELAKLALILFTAAVLERRMERIGEPKYALGPIVVVLVPMLALIMFQPDFGSSVVLLAIVGGHGVRGRPALAIPGERGRRGRAGRGRRGDSRTVPGCPADRLPGSVGRSVRHGLPGRAVAHRRRVRAA